MSGGCATEMKNMVLDIFYIMIIFGHEYILMMIKTFVEASSRFRPKSSVKGLN